MSTRRRRPKRKPTPPRKPTTTRTTTRTATRRRLDAIVRPVAATAGDMYRWAKDHPRVSVPALVVVAIVLGLFLVPGGDANQPAQVTPGAPATGSSPGGTPGTTPTPSPTTTPATGPTLPVRSTLGGFSLVQPWPEADDCPSVAQWEPRTRSGELVQCTLFAIPLQLGLVKPGTRFVFLGYQHGGGLEELLMLVDGPQGACAAGTVVSVPVGEQWRAILQALGRMPASGARPAINVPSALRCAMGAAR